MSRHFFVGIDPSLGSTGFVVFEDPKKVITAKTFNILPFDDNAHRFSAYRKLVDFLFDEFNDSIELPFNIDIDEHLTLESLSELDFTEEVFFHVMIERALYRVPRKRAAELYELNTIVQSSFSTGDFFAEYLGFENFGFVCDSIYPSSFKKEVTGNGRASKTEMADTLYELLGIRYEGKGKTDLTDAHLLAYLAYDKHMRMRG